MNNKCILLIFHGSATQEAKKAINSLRDYVKTKTNSVFYVCYLKDSFPNLLNALEEAYNNGARKIKCFPMLLLAGSHYQKDIPNTIKYFINSHKDTEVDLLPCLAENKDFWNFILTTIEKQ